MAAMIETERDDRVLIARIDNPPLNFMNREMVAELDQLTRSLRRDREVRAVVIAGKRPGLFITHYDVAEILDGVKAVGISPSRRVAAAMLRLAAGVRRIPGLRAAAARTPMRGLLELHRVHDCFSRLGELDKVVIAAIGGPATGGGCELALSCDLRYMAEGFTIGLPEMTIGFNPGAGGTQRLARVVGPGRALELMLEGRTLTAAEAERAGLVHRVLPAEGLLEESVQAAHRLARRAPTAVLGLKRVVHEGATLPLPRGLTLERSWFMAEAGEPESQRAMAAFVEQVERRGGSPWADPELIRPWQEGTADTGSEPDSSAS